MLLAGRRERLLGGRELEEENQALARAPPPRVATPNTLAHHRHRHPHARSALALAAAAHDRPHGGRFAGRYKQEMVRIHSERAVRGGDCELEEESFSKGLSGRVAARGGMRVAARIGEGLRREIERADDQGLGCGRGLGDP